MTKAVFRAAILALWAAMASAQSAPTVTVAQGTATGKLVRGGTQKAFLGLPYAAAPVGSLRWQAPQPAARYAGARDATKFGARCEQWPIWKDYIFQDAGPSEDCLFLNVYTPVPARPSSKLPVMVWIHGGGFVAGAGSEPRYSDSALVDKNVILVTLNYRLGVFGFLVNEDLVKEGKGHAGNYGLMDQTAALRWVKANIAQFGGDPGNVTIFGESAGSFSVNAQMTAPQARGLFQKAIGESGAFFSSTLSLSALADRAHRDQAFTQSLGAASLSGLRAMPADKILEAARKLSNAGFSPVLDGTFLTQSVPASYAAGGEAHVPTIIGWNRDERTNTVSKELTADRWKTFASEHYGPRAGEFLAAFPGADDAQAVRSADAYTTDGFIALGAWKWAEAQSATGAAPVYRYRFDLPAPPSEMHPEGKYAFHSDELEYVFGTLDTRVGATWRPEDRKLSEQMIAYWTNFARTGDPNGAGLPAWPRYDQTRNLIFLNNPVQAGPDAARSQYEFLTANDVLAH